jgi:hypothetical protein
MNWNAQDRPIEHRETFGVKEIKSCVQSNWESGSISFYYWPGDVPKVSECAADVVKWTLKSLKPKP